jgi:hypothetical protein
MEVGSLLRENQQLHNGDSQILFPIAGSAVSATCEVITAKCCGARGSSRGRILALLCLRLSIRGWPDRADSSMLLLTDPLQHLREEVSRLPGPDSLQAGLASHLAVLQRSKKQSSLGLRPGPVASILQNPFSGIQEHTQPIVHGCCAETVPVHCEGTW